LNQTKLAAHINIMEDVQMGTGTWAWGDRMFWGYGGDYSDQDLKDTFDASIAAGITFFDTAEIYGQGKSEQLLGQFMKTAQQKLFIASKFMPFPWKLSGNALVSALKHSLNRLDLPAIDLYQIHFPLPPVTIETWMDAMVRCVNAGLIRGVGVSNYDKVQMQRAYDSLGRLGIPLTSNQVEYSLLNRQVEKNGLFALCRELNVKVIAYSPLAQGLLTGKYTPDNPPSGVRSRKSNRSYLNKIQNLIQKMKFIGSDHDGKTPAQVALNWTICKGTIPIPGAKNPRQLIQNAGGAGWSLTDEEVATLDEISDEISAKR
jgi:aryl-alcohol dehydrogenase-like predicted oxidoreductase